MTWKPNVGKQTEKFLSELKFVPEAAKSELLERSLEIIEKAHEPGTGRNRVGLVIGYVQSGKTLSLTTVSALARDNGYGHIIILCGVTQELFKQNSQRVKTDLLDKSVNGDFVAKDNFQQGDIFYNSKFRLWHRSKGRNSTVVTFVLKHATNINKLTDLLKQAAALSEEQGIPPSVPTLVIDDEAHMAGINTKHASEEESNVYAALKRLRETLPDYAYLQYTATPQAPLLVQIADCVSPDYGIVLEPGEGYVGGQTFFPTGGNKKLIIEIPENEKPEGNEPPMPECIPDSLRFALHLYLVGLCELLHKGNRAGPRSMLVHPDKRKACQEHFKRLITKHLEFLLGVVDSGDEDEKAALRDEVKKAHKELAKTCGTLPTVEEIMDHYPEALEYARGSIKVVNTDNRDRIDWEFSNILIGGEVLGVGFTVRGLTISYMLRTSQKGQIDSMQQRARFFGYRGSDLGLTRVFLSTPTHKAFQDYVKHEEITRAEVDRMSKANKSLKEWKRHFMVTAGMQLTRKNIQSLSTIRADAAKTTHPLQPYRIEATQNQVHMKIWENVLSKWDLAWDKSCKKSWPSGQQHRSGVFDAAKVLDEIVAGFSWSDTNDVARWNSAYYLLKVLANEMAEKGEQMKVKVMLMRPEAKDGERGVTNDAWELLQGRSGDYPGDKALADPDITTLQLHRYTFRHGRTDKIIAEDILVPILIPAKSATKSMLQLVVQP